jgi:hypothetical protein
MAVMHDLPDLILTRYTDRAAAIAAERCREQDANDTEWAGAESRMRASIAFPEAGQFGSVQIERRV